MEGIYDGKRKIPGGKASGSMKERGNLKKGEKAAVLIVLVGLFGALLWRGGVKAYPDTNSYLAMSPNREPGYALLLNAAAVAGEKGFFAVGLLQNGLTVFSIYRILCYVGKVMKSRCICILAGICLILPHIMTPLFASSGLVLTNALLSEGICIPLYNLYFLSMWKGVWEDTGKGRNLCTALAIAFLLALIRGQMLVTLIAWVMVAVFLGRRNPKKLLLPVGAFIAVLVLRTLCVNGYNLAVNGKFTGTTYGAVTVLSNVVYVTDEAGKENIKDKELEILFEEIYRIADEGEMLYRYAPDGFTEEAAFYSRMHDEIKDEAIYPTLLNYTEHGEKIEDPMERLVRVDELASAMMKALLPGCLWEWLAHYIRNILVGLIRTVAFLHPLFNVPALAGYVLLVLMSVYCLRKDKKSRAAGLFFLAMLLTLGNTAAVALTIMCISRYMVYNMAFLYLSGFLLLGEIMKERGRTA